MSASLVSESFSRSVFNEIVPDIVSQTKANDYLIDKQMEETFLINLTDSSDADIAVPFRKRNQRTNGPVKAHLISWPNKAQSIKNRNIYGKEMTFNTHKPS